PNYKLYTWRIGSNAPTVVATEGTRGIPAGWWVSEHGKVSFSENGKRILFGTAPRPEPDPDEEEADDEKVKVDIWHWQDPYLQPMQLKQVERDRKRNYLAIVDIKSSKIVQLANESIPNVEIGEHDNADVALGVSNMPYRKESSWDWPAYYDVYIVNVRTGQQRLVAEKIQSRARLSPEAKYITWWNRQDSSWVALEVKRGRRINLSEQIPHPVYNELHDWAYPANPYGNAGWTEKDRLFLVYDKHDIWATDPTGKQPPRNITEGVGRADNLRFRYLKLDPEERAINPKATLLLSAFHLQTKASGFFTARVDGKAPVSPLVLQDKRFSTPSKAKQADTLLFTRSSYSEFPDLWVSSLDLSDMHKISDANPQQSEYLWGTNELMEWTSIDGKPLQGILFKPENFDPGQKYPMIVYFYERNSHNLHRHWAPAAHRSVIVPTFYASRGYLVFIPDIPYRVGYPGESALNAVLPGVTHLIKQGFVDADNIGVQGHSWGGYQIAFMVTRTNIFKAAEAGAPVSNMISAYGGIRWGTGRSRMFQYERTQSRIGGSLWEYPMRYMENSPIFWADKIETPLLMMHNDHDTAVPWYQGIELFVALRRLGKPVWMINYNGEPHWPTKFQNKRDWQIRLQQFFDHYLKGAPAPVWLEHGVPAIMKGKTL
ncbi:MAG: alpha/beta hydrolase family protein, partial [bacterium]